MRAATYRSSSYVADRSPGRRAVSLIVALLIVVGLIVTLLRMGGVTPPRFGDGTTLATFDVTARGQSTDQSSSQRKQEQTQAKRQDTHERPVRPVTPTNSQTPPLPTPPIVLPGVMTLNSADYAASDIGRIKGTAPRGDAAQGQSAGGGNAAGDSAAIGHGPGGEPLYLAEWYREPRRAETAPYMPVNKAGWGMVACRTAPRFHVEDCVELGETPGSGIARGLRQAAWQFLVRPPRKGGQPLIGAWVRIRFDLRAGKPDEDTGPDDAP